MEQCERTSKQMSKWSSTFVPILGCSEPLWKGYAEEEDEEQEQESTAKKGGFALALALSLALPPLGHSLPPFKLEAPPYLLDHFSVYSKFLNE